MQYLNDFFDFFVAEYGFAPSQILGAYEISSSTLTAQALGTMVMIGLFRNADWQISRRQYWLFYALCAALSTACSLHWGWWQPLYVFGNSWAIFVFEVISILLVSYAFARVHLARIRDVWPDGEKWWVGAIPFANIVLRFLPPTNPARARGRKDLMHIGVYVVALFFLSAINKSLALSVTTISYRAFPDSYFEDMTDTEWMRFTETTIIFSGLEEAAKDVAASAEWGEFDNGLRLGLPYVDDTTITYTLFFEDPAFPPPTDLGYLQRADCLDPQLRPILIRGYTTSNQVFDSNGELVSAITTGIDDCTKYGVVID